MHNSNIRVSVVIPAKNEEQTILEIIKQAQESKHVNEVIVSVDKNTSDNTARVASEAGAKVIQQDAAGFGNVIKCGLEKAKNNIIFKTDGDIKQFHSTWIDKTIEQLDDNTGLVKTYWDQENHTRSVTSLTVKPIIKYWCPDLAFIKMPLSGIYLFDKSQVDWRQLGNDWSFDLDLLLNFYFNGYHIKQTLIPEINDRRKTTKDLIPMAEEVVKLLHAKLKTSRTDAQRILIVMAHPDDAEIWAGGTIAQTCLNGGKVVSIVITGTNQRQNEAIAASKLIPGFTPIFFKQKQFSDFVNIGLAKKIANTIHDFKPSILITHHPGDFHIDHRRASDLTLLSLLQLGHKNYPEKVFYSNTYFQKDRLSNSFSPDTYVDISDFVTIKKRLITMHQSQRVDYYLQMAEAMDRMNGIKSGVKYAETFLTCTTHLTNKARKFL